MNKVLLLCLAVFIIKTPLNASYYSRIAASSKHIIKNAQDKITVLSDKIKLYETQKIVQNIEKDIPNAHQQSTLFQLKAHESSQDIARKSIHVNKSGLFGKAESVVVENVQINNYASKSFSEGFFEWLKRNENSKVAALSLTLGFTGGYFVGVHCNT